MPHLALRRNQKESVLDAMPCFMELSDKTKKRCTRCNDSYIYKITRQKTLDFGMLLVCSYPWIKTLNTHWMALLETTFLHR